MSIAIELSQNKSPNNKVDKVLEGRRTYQCTFLDEENVVNPRIRIATSDNLTLSNYVRISALGRYYFAVPTLVRTGLWEFQLNVDVLMSWASQIRELNAVIGRNSNIYNSYFHDDEISVYSNKIVQAKKFSNSDVFNANTFLLTTV